MTLVTLSASIVIVLGVCLMYVCMSRVIFLSLYILCYYLDPYPIPPQFRQNVYQFIIGRLIQINVNMRHQPAPGIGTHSYRGQLHVRARVTSVVLTFRCLKPTGHFRIGFGQSGIQARYAS